jgi:hypothetical protein
VSDAEFPDGFDTVIEMLNSYLHLYHDDIDPNGSRFSVGTYHAYDPKALKPKQIQQGNTLYPFQFFVRWLTSPIPALRPSNPAPADWEGPWRLDAKFRPATNQAQTFHLVSWDGRLTDVYRDSKEEMKMARFPYVGDLGDLSESARKQFARSLDEIDPPQYIVDGFGFLRTLAHVATYDDFGHYYSKWLPDKQNKQPWQSNVSPMYIGQVGQEITLQKGLTYAIHASADDVAIYRIFGVTRHLVHSGLMGTALPAKGEAASPPKKKKQDVILVYAADGLDKEWKQKKRDHYEKTGKRSLRRSVDPDAMVKAAVTDAHGKDLEKYLDIRDDHDWVIAMIKLYFPHRFQIFNTTALQPDMRRLVEMLDGDLRKEIKRVIEEEKGQNRGVMTDQDKAAIDKFLAGNDGHVVIPQLYPTENAGKEILSRFIGFDNMFAYMMAMDTGHVELMPVEDFLGAMALKGLAKDVYDSTKWLMPMMEYTAYFAAFAVGGWMGMGSGAFVAGAEMTGGEIVLGETLAEGATYTGFRAWAMRYATKEIAQKALTEAAKRLAPLLIAGVMDLLATLATMSPKVARVLYKLIGAGSAVGVFQAARKGSLPDPSDDEVKQFAERVKAFAEGFFGGYVHDAITEHILKHVLEEGITQGPREVRMLKTVASVTNAVDKFLPIINKLKRELDDDAIKLACGHFADAASRLARGAAVLLSTVYYLPHDEAKEILGALGLDSSGKPPDPEAWSVEANTQIRKITEAIAGSVKDNLSDAQSILEFAKNPYVVGASTVLMVMEAELILKVENKTFPWISKSFKSPNVKAFFWIALVPILATVGVATVASHDGLKAILKDGVKGILSLLGRTKEEAGFNGRLVGAVFGGFFLKKALFGHDTPIGKHMEKNALSGGFIWGNLKFGVIDAVFKMIFHRYVHMYDRLHQVAKELAPQKDRVLNMIRSIRAQKGDTPSEVPVPRWAEGQPSPGKVSWGHLEGFEKADAVPLKDIAYAIVALRQMVLDDISLFIKMKYNGDIKMYKADVEAFNDISKNFGFDIHQVTDKMDPKYLKMLYHQMANHLFLALDELAESLKSLLAPFTKSGYSWLTLLEEVGLHLGDINRVQEEVMKVARDELQVLRKK